MIVALTIFMGVLLLFAGLATALWVSYVPQVVRMIGTTPPLVAERLEPLDEGEACQFTAADGCMLWGTYLPTTAPERLGVIAFSHELNGDRWNGLRYFSDLREQGFDIFTFDYRNHGDSQTVPGYQPLPWLAEYEIDDLRAAVDYLTARDDSDPRGIGLLGVSKGGAAALTIAGTDSRIRAVATDGAYPIEAMQMHFVRRYMDIATSFSAVYRRIPSRLLALAPMWARVFLGRQMDCRFPNADLSIRRVRQPVLMIHGQRDSLVPMEVVRELRAMLAGPSKLWVVPRAKHNGAIFTAPAEYHRRVARFFIRHLAEQAEPTQPTRTFIRPASIRPSTWMGRGARRAELAVARSSSRRLAESEAIG